MRNPPIVDPLGSHRIVEDITSAQRKVAEIHDPSLRCLLAGTLDRQCDLCARLHRLEARGATPIAVHQRAGRVLAQKLNSSPT
jgi:hypothetical protein